MGEFSIGQSVRRREDPRLLTGRGRYFDDLKLAGSVPCGDRALAACPCRHQGHRHAGGAADAGRARRADRQGLSRPTASARCRRWRPTRGATAARCTCRTRPAIAIDRVLHVGYPVAVVVADTLDLARDAAERVEVDYAPRPAVVSAREAFEPARRSSTTIARTTRPISTRPATRPRPMPPSPTPRTSSSSAWSSTASPPITLEPRGVTGEYDRGTGRYTLHCGFQRPWLFRNAIAETTMKIPEAELRLITGDIGGSYGLRGSVYPEIILMLWAARRVGRPVKWTQHPERSAHQRRRRARQHRRCGAGARPGRQVPRRAHPQLRQSRRLRVVSRRDAAGGQYRHGRAASTRRRRCMWRFPAC